jgi:hypothetical protein
MTTDDTILIDGPAKQRLPASVDIPVVSIYGSISPNYAPLLTNPIFRHIEAIHAKRQN